MNNIMLFKLFLFLSTFRVIFAYQNNICKKLEDYNNPYNNKNCYYDPNQQLDPAAIIKKYAGIVETHTVIAEDGYIINLFRIPKINPKGIILIHHSIATSSHIYLWQGNTSLAMTLWQSGFDVWLANQRGTSYSDKHVNMTSKNYVYWNFSFHEMGFYDVSAELQLIRQRTNDSKVIFIGHSLGSTIGLVYASLKSTEAKNYLKAMVLLATPAYFNHVTSLAAGFFPFKSILEAFASFFRMGSPLLLLPLIVPLSRILLRIFPGIIPIVVLFILWFCGNTPQETDPTFFNYDAAIYGNDFSWKTLIHYLQMAGVNRFQMYDYGKEKNLKIYGNDTPPVYPVRNIRVPTLIVSSVNDSLTTIQDSEMLLEELYPKAKVYGHWKLAGLNHFDYLAGINRREIVINNLLKFLNSI